MSGYDKWHSDFESLTEEQQRILGRFMYAYKKPAKSKSKFSPTIKLISNNVRQIERTLNALRGLAALYEQYPDEIQRYSLQQMAGTLHTEVTELIVHTMTLGLPETKEAAE
jgi:hypothetical protein